MLSVFLMCTGNSHDEKDKTSYFLERTGKQKEVLKELFSLLSNRGNTPDGNFLIAREIANQYRRLNDNYRMINFLSMRVNDNPQDPYNSYYLLRMADCYLREGSRAIAALYFDVIVENYNDLVIRGESIHLACLQQLITLVDDPARDVAYYKKLIDVFPDKIDLAQVYFMLGQAEERNGNWMGAIEAYRNFMPFYGVIIQGFPDAYSYAKQMIDFYNAEKNHNTPATKFERTYESLPQVISVIKSILESGDTYRLWSYRARVNFFARSWTLLGNEDEELSSFSISTLYSSGKIQYAAELSAGSGSNDVYLRTWGWSKITPVWYFYFRKIYFPMDPDLHGRWEWAGIYYGERF
jgi:tetratricopeptide (TPR) repeat protein